MTSLSIQQHGINNIRVADLIDLENLISLEIIDGDLNSIEDGAFIPLVNMETLILNHNYLTSLPQILVAPEAKLQEIQLK